jgi:hypothetical protein
MRSMVEGACGREYFLMQRHVTARAPSTTLLRSVVPLPRLRGAGCRKGTIDEKQIPPAACA